MLHRIESIASFVPLTDKLATAGQPSQEQLATVAAGGFKVFVHCRHNKRVPSSLHSTACCVKAGTGARRSR
jgi:protein tyrosine phosphatase (PTP) superfamily phosphohydrolase (DUF442 family)